MRRLRTKASWCDRTLLQAQYIGLCTTEAQFNGELRRLDVDRCRWPRWVLDGAHATTHYFTNSKRGRIAIVCIDVDRKRTIEQVHALLVHEAVHIWRSELEHINEEKPGHEIEAYAIQNIAQGLMTAHGKRK